MPDIVAFFKALTKAECALMSQVETLLKLVLVMPATNAESERSFSAMRRVKNYLRSCMSEDRLNHLMLLHVHKHSTDTLDVVKVVNRFTAAAFGRDSFGSFSALDLSRASVLQKSQSTQTRTDSACVKSDKCEAGKSSMQKNSTRLFFSCCLSILRLGF